ncbi:Crp/Fnr family transcriptional regulator [Aestuariirhabdus litorea]|uniref:Crp/Fnr family transcriptional regulator n=1 Tax=Aestuariirhabdus litorea TaxID=2528527 RepID=A0A3P3VLY5_9GAMM|nr:Crp/Fnr family transcriptional regulator [Aestuariirhabdus litorea]RRJ83640.1 Crp/Fnr family transcriptional regulator [Aestuariirhabdus litorea]RWW96861.1 cyclic nucleotide-binding domain-containing protein [Endozoicomonadaceae bacterium GTF-13]
MRYPTAYKTLCDFFPLPLNQWLELESEVGERQLHKGEWLLQPGERPTMAYQVCDGLCRSYYLSHEGKEFTKHFHGPGELLAPLAELITGEPSRGYIQAVTPARVLTLPYLSLTRRYQGDRCWLELGRRLAEHIFLQKEVREFELLQLNAEQRYGRYLERFSELVEQTPQYMIASYLGITPVALSRLISRRKNALQAGTDPR